MNLHTLSLPGKECPSTDFPWVYERLLRDHGIRTKAQIAILREEVVEHLMSLQDAIICQNTADVFAGKYKNEADMKARMPLYRDGDTMRNIPDEIMRWYAFTAWLNERTEKRVN
ncbi:MAG: hypothetical protein IKH57_12345 [Clostridia bacterium]|nr:hypothetical protein [Clostridia bacterium]